MTVDELPLALTVDELRKLLGCGRATAYELVRSGRIRSIRLGEKTIRIPREAVAELLAADTMQERATA